MTRRISSLLMVISMLLSLLSCGGNTERKIADTTPQPNETDETYGDSGEEAQPEESMKNNSILVAYFSCTGTTKALAEYAAEILNADLYEITPEEPYTEADLAYYTDCRADREQNDPDARPKIADSVEEMEKYDTVILGYPIWHGQAPRIVSTFLESYDLTGKKILPFCTSASSGIGSSDTSLHALAEKADWLDGKRFSAGTTKEEIASWLEENGINS